MREEFKNGCSLLLNNSRCTGVSDLHKTFTVVEDVVMDEVV